MKYSRVLLKLSGEAFSGKTGPIDFTSVDYIVGELKSVCRDTEIAVVVGGGNIWRGAKKKEIERVAADYIGMHATTLNGLVLKEKLKSSGIPSEVFSFVASGHGLRPAAPASVSELLTAKNVVIFTGGTGHPYFTTDTAAALCAVEIGADVLVKATQVDGVYDSDPKVNPSAKIFEKITYKEALDRNLGVMDMSAFLLCKDNSLPIIVYNFYKKGSLKKVISGEKIGTIVGNLHFNEE